MEIDCESVRKIDVFFFVWDNFWVYLSVLGFVVVFIYDDVRWVLLSFVGGIIVVDLSMLLLVWLGYGDGSYIDLIFKYGFKIDWYYLVSI